MDTRTRIEGSSSKRIHRCVESKWRDEAPAIGVAAKAEGGPCSLTGVRLHSDLGQFDG